MKIKTVKKILISIIISIVLINLIYANLGGVFAADMGNVKISNMIKESVAKWYYIMRLSVIAFMLVLLIFIGIKMALSNIASQKAVYKKMMVDWLVGMILVFSIHYIMVFILTLNDNVVEALEPLVSSKLAIEKEAEFGAESNNKTASEIETTLYESARTRAYSLKMTDGFTGIIIYGALVYYAWKYTLMYFRRVINIMILTLLAPAVSGSYAFNKVMTGKAKVFSTWLSEYIMNVAVQSVHVIIYASFVGTALKLSLQSLPGVILTIIILNFMTKADGILRGIFKLSGGKGSLAGDMTDRSTFADLKKEVKGMTNVMVGGMITKKAMGLTYRVATKPIRAVAEKKFGELMEKRANDPNYIAVQEAKEKKKEDDALAVYMEYRKNLGLDKKEKEIKKETDELEKRAQKAKKEKNVDELQKIIQEIEENEKKQDAFEAQEQQVQDDFLKYYYASGTEKETIKKGIQAIFKAENYTEEITKAEVDRYREISQLSDEDFESLSREEKEMFEEFQKLDEQGKLEVLDENGNVVRRYRRKVKTHRDKEDENAPWRKYFNKKNDGVGMRFANKLKLKSILGLSADEQKVIKDIAKFYKDSTIGIISGIAGLSTVGSNFGIGAGLMVKSFASKGEMRKRAGYLYNRPNYKWKGTYRFKAFSNGTQDSIYKEAMKYKQFLESQHATGTTTRSSKAIERMLNGGTVTPKPILVAGIVFSGMSVAAPLQGRVPYYNRKDSSLKRSLTYLDEDKLYAMRDKRLKDQAKDSQKRVAYLNSKTLKEDFDKKFKSYVNTVEEDAKNTSTKSLLIQDFLSMGDTIVVPNGSDKAIVQVKDDGEISQLVKRADTINKDPDITMEKKLEIIKSDIAKHETELIEDSIARVCAKKGISNVENLDLTELNKLEIRKEILLDLEKRGIVQKGEIVFDENLVSSEKIEAVHESLVEDFAKNETSNYRVKEVIVQKAILEYMQKNKIVDKKMLQNDSAKAQIYDIIKEMMISETSKCSGDVIEQISGINKLKQQTKLPDEMMELVDKTATKVRRKSLIKAEQKETAESLEKLIERSTVREVNRTLEELIEDVHLDEDDLLLRLNKPKTSLNKASQKKLELLFYTKDMVKENQRAKKAGDTTKRKGNKEQTAAELEYYMLQAERRVDRSRDGSRRVASSDGNKDISKRVKELEVRLHGQNDIIDFLNKPRRKGNK